MRAAALAVWRIAAAAVAVWLLVVVVDDFRVGVFAAIFYAVWEVGWRIDRATDTILRALRDRNSRH